MVHCANVRDYSNTTDGTVFQTVTQNHLGIWWILVSDVIVNFLLLI